ncbi:MAG TPA: biotin/lipoyl-binding protein [Planctomycetes bacterium]|nr:biotin/lipoyl-binding protein [Planctomycetota bacterium]
MKYFVNVNGTDHIVELAERLGELSVTLDGEPVDVTYRDVDRLGQVGLFLGDRSYAVSIQGDDERSYVTVAGHLYDVVVEDERERAAHQAERARGAGSGDVKSVMPGVVLSLLVSEGDEVEEGQPLLILEAMKMQNEICAPSAGRVGRVHVSEGEAVASGAKLVTIQAASAD